MSLARYGLGLTLADANHTYVEVKDSIRTPSLVVISWVHHVFDFALKSPNIVKKVDPNGLTSFRILSRLCWELLNSK